MRLKSNLNNISQRVVVLVVLNLQNVTFLPLHQHQKMISLVKQFPKVKILENIIEHKFNVHLLVIHCSIQSKIIISYFCKTKLNQLNYTKKRILVHKFYPTFAVLILKNQHLFNVIQYLVYDNKMILWHVLKLDLVKP